jgi:Mg2+ and Co2+ transporter CorA
LSQAISIRKETNCQAILVFTIVTVVFLPLSFITSYLGMNSIDIRNAAFTQLRFWELAIPLTVIVLLAVWGLVKFKRRLSRGIRSVVRRCIRR